MARLPERWGDDSGEEDGVAAAKSSGADWVLRTALPRPDFARLRAGEGLPGSGPILLAALLLLAAAANSASGWANALWSCWRSQLARVGGALSGDESWLLAVGMKGA